jgi:urease accessory protein
MNSAPVTSTEQGGGDFTWLLALLQASDSFYPTGGYAHSFGLEGLVQEGVVTDRVTLREFLLEATLPSLARVDLPLAAHAWRAFAEPEWTAVEQVSRLSSALRASRESRAASEAIGRQRAELAAALYPGTLAPEFLRRGREGRWPHAAPVSAALEGRVTGAPLDSVLASVCYSNLAGLIAAAMKLLRLGQNGAQSLLAETLAATPPLIAAATHLPLEEIGWFNPWLDIASARHERAAARLFIS